MKLNQHTQNREEGIFKSQFITRTPRKC